MNIDSKRITEESKFAKKMQKLGLRSSLKRDHSAVTYLHEQKVDSIYDVSDTLNIEVNPDAIK